MLAALTEAGREPTVVEYLKTGWTEAQLTDLFARMGVTPRQAMRVRGTPAEELGADRSRTPPTRKDILTAMVAHPILVERPIVITAKGVALCRPAERLDALL